MKNYCLLLGITLILIACNRNDQETPQPTDFGYISMSISVSITEEPASGRVEAVSTDDWRVTIYDATDDSEVMVFDPYSSAPSEVQLATGEYYIEAHSNNFLEAAFENPYYFGRSANFTIDKEELKTIDIDAELANSKVAINYSSNVISTFNDYTGAVTVVSTGSTLPYIQGETREGYFSSELLSVEVNLSYNKLDGTFITRQFNADIDAQPRTLYNVNVDATLEDGKIILNITVNEDFDTVEIELGDAGSDTNSNWEIGEDWIDERNGKSYGTVQVGEQVWMSENLNVQTYTDGTPIPRAEEGTIWYQQTTPLFGYYDNDEEGNGELYGGLYNWYAVETGKLCPAGWHVPTENDWITLETYLGGYQVAGAKLKQTGTSLWQNPNYATNEVGFNAIPGGMEYGAFAFINQFAVWWTSTEKTIDRAEYRYVRYDEEWISPGRPFKDHGLSIRCIKD